MNIKTELNLLLQQSLFLHKHVNLSRTQISIAEAIHLTCINRQRELSRLPSMHNNVGGSTTRSPSSSSNRSGSSFDFTATVSYTSGGAPTNSTRSSSWINPGSANHSNTASSLSSSTLPSSTSPSSSAYPSSTSSPSSSPASSSSNSPSSMYVNVPLYRDVVDCALTIATLLALGVLAFFYFMWFVIAQQVS